MAKTSRDPAKSTIKPSHAETPGTTREVDRFAQTACELEGAPLNELQRYWRHQFGRAAPNLGRSLLYRLLLYRLQADAFGDLAPKVSRLLDTIAQDSKCAEIDLRRTGLSPGTILVREHGGVDHYVTVTSDGFLWRDQNFQSLSQVAYAITGTKWNGPRFFGLRSSTDA